MKEDVLEQVVDDYLKQLGYFTQHNIKFRPRKDHPDYVSRDDSVHSDVDVLGIDPRRTDLERVVIVSCKSQQSGFDATGRLAQLRGERKNPKRETWRAHRELWVPKWSEAFRATVEARTGETKFAYLIAVTRLRGDADAWGRDPTIAANLPGCSVGFLTFEQIWRTTLEGLGTAPAASEIGRLAQLLKAAGLVRQGAVETKP